MKYWTAFLIIILIAAGVQLYFIFIQNHTLELKIVERNGLYIVQSNMRCGLISDWDDEKKFRSKNGAENYMNEWYSNYNALKKTEPEIGD